MPVNSFCTRFNGLIFATSALLIVSSCGGGGGGGGPPPPPPPPANESPAGIWAGLTVSQAAADVFENFEFSATGGFERGTTPYRATYSNGNAETRGVPAFYISGLNAWHILVGTSATVTFETLPNTLTFFVRTDNAGDVSNIDILDENGVLIQNVVPTNAYQPLNNPISVVRGAGQTLIGSMEVTSTSGGDVVIDDLTFGYSGSGFVGGMDDIECVVSEMMELVCIIAAPPSFQVLVSAEATLQIANVTEVSGTGTLYAAPGSTLSDGSTVAPLTITAGTISEGNTLNLTVDGAGSTNDVSMVFDAIYNRGSTLATVAAVYAGVTIFGDVGSFVIDATGVITGQSPNCVLNGQVSIIDANFNAYDVQLDASLCGGLDGTYDGLGISEDDRAPDDTFGFVVTNALNAIAGLAIK